MSFIQDSRVELTIILFIRNGLPSLLEQTSISPRSSGRPTYDKAHLSELKASTPGSRPSHLGNDPYNMDISIDPYDLSMSTIEMVTETGDTRNSLGQNFPAYVVFTDENAMSIPSESSIAASKQKRERLRASATDDYISLSVIRRSDESAGPHPESRLMREDDDLGEGDDGASNFKTIHCQTH
jgi:GC-rich sequence DNA-binding factor